MLKIYALIIKHWYYSLFLILIFIITALFVNIKFINVIQIFQIMLISGFIFGLPLFCIVYFVFTKRNEISLQIVSLDLFFSFLTILCFIGSIIKSQKQIIFLKILFTIPFAIIGIRIAYSYNKKLLSFLKK